MPLAASPAGILWTPEWPVSHQNDSQKAPYDENAVAPKVFPLANSHIPASSWAPPPYARARPNTTGSTVSGTRPAFTKLRKKVVRANAANPRGAGSARCGPGVIPDETADEGVSRALSRVDMICSSITDGPGRARTGSR